MKKNSVVAHRGAWKAKTLPENSIASLQEAIRLGCIASEFDVRMTADDSLLVTHDPDYAGKLIEKTSYNELRKTPLSNGEPLPTLREYLLAAKQRNGYTQLVCEIKPSSIQGRGNILAEKVVALVKELGAEKITSYISFDYEILKAILIHSPHAITQYLNGDKAPDELLKDGIVGLDYHYSVYQKHPEWIEIAKKNKMILNAWTVNDEKVMDWLIENGFDYITTNEPEMALKKWRR